MPLQLKRAHDLNKFSGRRSGLEVETQSRYLHGDCRCSGARSAADQAEPRAKHCDRIRAWVTREILIFVLKCRVDQLRRHVAQRSPDPKFLVGCESDAKQLAVAIAHGLRK